MTQHDHRTFVANERGIRVEVVYPQAEPSDAQVEAAMREHDYSLDRETTRNVLRAAFATNQEENR